MGAPIDEWLALAYGRDQIPRSSGAKIRHCGDLQSAFRLTRLVCSGCSDGCSDRPCLLTECGTKVEGLELDYPLGMEGIMINNHYIMVF